MHHCFVSKVYCGFPDQSDAGLTSTHAWGFNIPDLSTKRSKIRVMWRCLSFEQKTCQMLAISMNIKDLKFMFHFPLSETLHTSHYTLMECKKNPLWAALYPNLFWQLPNLPEKNPTPRDCSSNMEICVLRILSCSAFTKPAFIFWWRKRSFQISSLRSFLIGKLATFERLWIFFMQGSSSIKSLMKSLLGTVVDANAAHVTFQQLFLFSQKLCWPTTKLPFFWEAFNYMT